MKHYLYAFGAILCWASLPVATGSGLKSLSTEELMFYSFTTAAIYLYIQESILTRKFSISLPGPKATLLGVWGIFGYHFTYYEAMNYAPLAEGAILATTWSFWIVFFSSLLLFRTVKLPILGAAGVGMIGAALVISAGEELSFSLEYMRGYLLALLCGLIWSSFSVMLGRMNLKKDPMTLFTLYAALISTVIFFLTGPHEVPARASFLSAVYLGCVPLGLSFFLWSRAVTGGNMVIIGFLSYLAPPLSVLLVSLVHGQRVSAQVLMGMVLIITASIGGRLLLKKDEEGIKLRKAKNSCDAV